MKKINNLINLSKTTLLIPLFALTLHSCKDNKETGIVKAKIDNKVYLTPVNDTDNVYRVIDFNQGRNNRVTKNLYLNMNHGDTVTYNNRYGGVEIIPAEYDHALFGGGLFYYVKSINGVGIHSLPDLVKKQKEDEAIKQLQEKYQEDLNTKSR